MHVVLPKRLMFLVVTLLICGVAQAENGSRGPVHTTPPKDDPSFLLMGEFVGSVDSEESESQTVALQIRPISKDQFEAIAYFGGLPGDEEHRPEPKKMIGQRHDGFLVLSGAPWAIFAEQDRCLLIDPSGERVGTLERVTRRSPTLGAKPPEGAMVLFNGSDADQFTGGELSDDGLLMAGAVIKPMFQDFDLHLEFRLPYMPHAKDQGRGNSGVYIQSRYECQILDSFAQQPVFNGAGSLYRYRAPSVNMSFPPLVWQTYDIRFTAPRWASDGEKIRNARVSVWLNGVLVQDDVELEDKTGAGQGEAPVLLPTKLQDHTDPVRFRNIWVIDRGLFASAEFPVEGTGEEEPEPSPSAEQVAAQAAEQPAEQPAEEPASEPAESEPAESEPAADAPAPEEPAPDAPSPEEPAADESAPSEDADSSEAAAAPAESPPAE
jgi:hypothetical protein